MKILAAFLGLAIMVGTGSAQPAREVAFTIDDLPWVSAVPQPPEDVERHTEALLAGLAAHRIPAIGFVNEGKLHRGGGIDERQVRLLQRWKDAGLELGNHTYSHRDFHATPLDEFQREIVRGEEITTKVMGRPPRYFRHPMLHTGRTLEDKRGLESFLAQRGYRIAPVTIDNYDYVFARAYDRAAGKERARVLDAYIEYMTAMAAYYEQQSTAIVGREIRQVLLLHANTLNAHGIDRLARMFERRGYTFITLDRALDDPAYASGDTFTGAAGITWLHRWALTQGKRGIFGVEPPVPDWIASAGK
jgi:peptidoglycan/xylan/chitin deacetylase (PgdA/CDA1 family)